MKILSLLCFIVLFTFQVNAQENELRPLSHVSSKECGQCHQQIYGQWKESMHAKSSALVDPIHGSFYNAVIGDPKKEGLQKKGKYPVCLQCHAPSAAKDGKTKLDTMPAYNEGVNCVSCHSFTQFKGVKKPNGGLRLGVKAYKTSETKLQGSRDIEFHPDLRLKGGKGTHSQVVGNPTVFKTNAVCMGCHDQRNNSKKVPLCQTGSEISEPKNVDCQLCHMPIVNGKPDHSLMGGHSAKMVSKGLLMTIDVSDATENHTVSVTLKNKLPHNLPTGAPFRNIYVLVTAYDDIDQVIWQNSPAGHPAKDDKKSMLMYALGDKDGKPAPPPKATQVLYDSRLKPYESRILSYTVTKKGVSKIKAEAFYDLLLPPLKKKFANKIPANLRQSQSIATAVINL
jgi:nitrate/TMAO reductase-like tetraheme cytochrome c subunit